MFSCTEYEAGRLGKFMRENFALLHSWKADEATYEKECHAVCGFNLKLNDPGAGKVSYAEYASCTRARPIVLILPRVPRG